MAWIISTRNDEKDRTEYVRRITPEFVSWTVDRADAARYPTRREVSKAATRLRRAMGDVSVIKPWQAAGQPDPADDADDAGRFNPL